MSATHDVFNVSKPLSGHNVVSDDAALVDAVRRHGGDSALDDLAKLGGQAGSAQARGWGEQANTRIPQLRTHDRFGHRIDTVDYDASYHALMDAAVTHGLHAAAWSDPHPAAHVIRAAGFIAWSQVEAGHMCPISMTYAAVPALRADTALFEAWTPGLTARHYDPHHVTASQKSGLIAGMAMTEKQGGSDVRANTTTAVPDGDAYRLSGHKWFCSAPMSDVFLTLAHAPGGLTCFVVPRWLSDGTRNAIDIQRLKDKLGNRSNASAEIEYDSAVGYRLGEEGRGVRTIVEMVSATRLDCVLGSTAIMRAALTEAIWHTSHRQAFGTTLIDAPLMRSVLADLALDVEAAIALGMRLAAAVDTDTESERALRRIALPAAKLTVTKRAIIVTGEALECLGGNGYVEESGMPRLYREAPVNSVWEGSGNVNALDLIRAMTREDDTISALSDELDRAVGVDHRFDDARRELLDTLRNPTDAQLQARWLAERTAVLLQASLLLRYAPAAVTDAFIATRVADYGARLPGTLPVGTDMKAIIDRSTPVPH